MTVEQLEQQQKALDKTKLICPKCGTETDWWFYRNYGCEKEFIESMAKETNYSKNV